ncbi:MAG: pantoate--beta-alanine ligase [Armatimonadetes bacterium]|nr:pantoate--beta-alanine ligase [Armatimonadota bacterium]
MVVEADLRNMSVLVREEARKGRAVGFVPTMGALHEGHLSLVRRCRAENDLTVVSIFVNPTQFGPNEDLDTYPRTFEADCAALEALGCDVVFAPRAQDMYAADHSTWVIVEGLTEPLCGRYRPGHFRGVTTVVAKLFNIVRPDRAYFGQKDYQQLKVIERMVRDLNFGIEIVPCPTVREPDGLAMSSRNAYLSAEERAVAPALYAALVKAAEAVRAGASGDEVEEMVRRELSAVPAFEVQYVEAVHPETLEPARWAGPPMVIAAAAFLGRTRLIDNVIVES